jgi:hypothetical protein
LSSSSLSGGQKPPPNFPSSCALWRVHSLAGAAAPPPSGTGRRGCLHRPPDLLGMLACSPATRRAHARTK